MATASCQNTHVLTCYMWLLENFNEVMWNLKTFKRKLRVCNGKIDLKPVGILGSWNLLTGGFLFFFAQQNETLPCLENLTCCCDHSCTFSPSSSSVESCLSTLRDIHPRRWWVHHHDTLWLALFSHFECFVTETQWILLCPCVLPLSGDCVFRHVYSGYAWHYHLFSYETEPPFSPKILWFFLLRWRKWERGEFQTDRP